MSYLFLLETYCYGAAEKLLQAIKMLQKHLNIGIYFTGGSFNAVSRKWRIIPCDSSIHHESDKRHSLYIIFLSFFIFILLSPLLTSRASVLLTIIQLLVEAKQNKIKDKKKKEKNIFIFRYWNFVCSWNSFFVAKIHVYRLNSSFTIY